MHTSAYHFLGIGGSGMSALAHILLERGCDVSGVDLNENRIVRTLRSKGAAISIAHHIPISKEKTVVYSTAIEPNHPSITYAKRLNLPLMHRSELLSYLFEGKRALLIAGTHGKTSTSALLSHTLTASGLNPSFAIGGLSPSLCQNGKHSAKDLFVAEADESDGSFLRYRGFGGIITNIDNDHLDFWQSEKALIKGFETFMSRITHPSYFFWCRDDPILAKLSPKGVSYGWHREANIRLVDLSCRDSSLECIVNDGAREALFSLPLIGEHQALNALPVIGMSRLLGLSDEEIRMAFQTFRSVGRRLEKKGEVRGITIYDDYAHHPTAIRAVLTALREKYPKRRLIPIFEPHRFSRIKAVMPALIEAFSLADLLVITDVFSAGELPLEGITGENLAASIDKAYSNKTCYYFPRDTLFSSVLPLLCPQDVVVTIGAGGITSLAAQLCEKVR